MLRSSSLYNFLNSDLTSQIHIFSPVYAVLSQCQTKFHTHTEHRQRVLEVHVQARKENSVPPTQLVQTVVYSVAERQILTIQANIPFHWNLTICLSTYDVGSPGVSGRR